MVVERLMAFRSINSAVDGVYTHNSLTIPAPAGIVDGDILALRVSCYTDNANPTFGLPAGFTKWYDQYNGSYHGFIVAWKRASSESGSYVISNSGTANSVEGGWEGCIAAYSGRLSAADPLSVGSNTAYVTSDTVVEAAGITALLGDDVIWAGAAHSTTTLTVPAGMNARLESSYVLCGGTNICGAFGDLLNVAAGATLAKDGTAGASITRKHAFLVGLKIGLVAPVLTAAQVASDISVGWS
jgi:hypothetical protein